MNRNQGEYTPVRPVSIYVVSLWSLLRGLLVGLSLYGEFIFLEAAFGLGYGNGNLSNIWSLAPLDIKFGIAFSAFQVLIFLIFTIGIVRGDNWSRLGFIIISIAVLLWKTFGVLSNIMLLGEFRQVHQILYNLLGVSIALWYFDQHHILEYFGVKQRVFNWGYQQIRGYPKILIIVFGLSTLIILLELVSLGTIAQIFYY